MDNLKTITEVAKETGTTVNQLRYWADKGLVECRKNAQGVRFFSIDDYSRIELIKKTLAQPKATLEDARRAVFGDQAVQQKKTEEQLLTTEQMIQTALDKTVEHQLKEIFEGMLSAYTQISESQARMSEELAEIRTQNSELKQQVETLTTGVEQMSDNVANVPEVMDNIAKQVAAAAEQYEANWNVTRNKVDVETDIVRELQKEIEDLRMERESQRTAIASMSESIELLKKPWWKFGR